MLEIILQSIPNQKLSIQLDDANYDITLKAGNGCMSVTISRDEVVIVSGLRIVAGTPLIPFKYLEAGNFVLTTENDDLPDYTKFGSSQSLVYASQAEIEVLRGSA